MGIFLKFLSKQPQPILMAIALVLIGLIGLSDYLTGYEISFSIFYLLPISLST